jgi:hypothetical protein
MKSRWLSLLGPFTMASIVICLLTTVLSFIYTQTGPVVAIVAAHLPLFVALAERKNDTRGDLRYMPSFSDPYMQRLAEEVRKTAEETHKAALDALVAMEKPGRVFRTEGEFFHFAETRVRPLGEGARVVVACGEPLQRWSSTAIKRWVAANSMSAKRGVDFVRIVIARDHNVLPIALEQQAQGIRILIVDPKKIDGLPDLCRIPEDAGIAVVNGEEVYFHNGNSANFYGVFVDSRMLASVVLSMFSTLEANADPLPGLAPAA